MLRMIQTRLPPTSPKTENPLRFGVLGAARIGPNAILTPVKSHEDVVVAAVACRDKTRGDEYAKAHGISKVYAGRNCYQELLDDPDIDAVYNPLPNGLHFEWTMRAIDAGKHVLVEKPMTSTADEARQVFARAEAKGLVVLEAVHITFHPATQRVKEIVESGELGRVKSAESGFAIPTVLSPLFFLKDDIRYSFDLAGGCTTDMGVYPLTVIRYLTGTDATAAQVTYAKAAEHPLDPSRVDRGETFCDFLMPGWGPFGLIPRMPQLSVTLKMEGGEIEFFNYIIPHAFHYIRVRPRKGKSRTEQVYKRLDGSGDSWWTTYRYQLESFVDKVRGRTPQYWPDPATSISKMECIERIYEKAGLPPRPASSYKPE